MARWQAGPEPQATSVTSGRQAEQRAAAYLQDHGLKLIRRNYHAPCGEIDLIMQDGDILVFIEVRHRKSESFCKATETIDIGKQQRLRATAEHYLQQHAGGDDHDCRFDVLTLTGPIEHERCHWVTNAL